MNTTDIRKQFRHTRNTLSATQQSEHAQQAFAHFKSLIHQNHSFTSPQKIALFLSQDGELSTEQAIQHLWNETDHQVYLPVLETRDEWHMAFVHYTENSLLLPNQFNINEPKAPLEKHLQGREIDWVFMPLVGFDSQGNRLGMGGGYYDRTFAFKLEQPTSNTKLIGWAHQCQQSQHNLPSKPWDVPLNGVLTETGFRSF